MERVANILLKAKKVRVGCEKEVRVTNTKKKSVEKLSGVFFPEALLCMVARYTSCDITPGYRHEHYPKILRNARGSIALS